MRFEEKEGLIKEGWCGQSKTQFFAAFWLHGACHNADAVKSSNGEDPETARF